MKNKKVLLSSLITTPIITIPSIATLTSYSNNSSSLDLNYPFPNENKPNTIETIKTKFNQISKYIDDLMNNYYDAITTFYPKLAPEYGPCGTYNKWGDFLYSINHLDNLKEKQKWEVTLNPNNNEKSKTYYFCLTEELFNKYFSGMSIVTAKDLADKNIYPLVIAPIYRSDATLKEFEIPNTVKFISPGAFYGVIGNPVNIGRIPHSVQYIAGDISLKPEYLDLRTHYNLKVIKAQKLFSQVRYSKDLLTNFPPNILELVWNYFSFKGEGNIIDINSLVVPESIQVYDSCYLFDMGRNCSLLTDTLTIQLPKNLKNFDFDIDATSSGLKKVIFDFTKITSPEQIFPISNVVLEDKNEEPSIVYNKKMKIKLIGNAFDPNEYDYSTSYNSSLIGYGLCVNCFSNNFSLERNNAYFKFPLSWKDRLECTGKYSYLKGQPLYEINNYQMWKDAGFLIYVDEKGNPIQ